jgi:hypothetical protein
MPNKIAEFHPPQQQQQQQQQLEYQDCLSCRIIGTATFSGLCGYSSYMLYTVPKSTGVGHRAFLGSLIVFTGYMGIYRLLRP